VRHLFLRGSVQFVVALLAMPTSVVAEDSQKKYLPGGRRIYELRDYHVPDGRPIYMNKAGTWVFKNGAPVPDDLARQRLGPEMYDGDWGSPPALRFRW
jgi:hypothetical protein